ncbi:MAG: hypothetical protein QOF89_4703 [Acidobacteriota bacterium]|jgi:hypothetical protein|nr:hypothetical protein [Acidobacteriota bacterium]
MKIFEHKGRILRTAGLIAALAVASLPVSKVTASPCTDMCAWQEKQCEASCPPLGSPGHFTCIAACRSAYQSCIASCP